MEATLYYVVMMSILMTSWFKFKCRFHVGVIQNKSLARSKVPTTQSVDFDLKRNFGWHVQDHKSWKANMNNSGLFCFFSITQNTGLFPTWAQLKNWSSSTVLLHLNRDTAASRTLELKYATVLNVFCYCPYLFLKGPYYTHLEIFFIPDSSGAATQN